MGGTRKEDKGIVGGELRRIRGKGEKMLGRIDKQGAKGYGDESNEAEN